MELSDIESQEESFGGIFVEKYGLSQKLYPINYIFPRFIVGYTENWRENEFFPDLRANERENQKSKENHMWQIQRAFE